MMPTRFEFNLEEEIKKIELTPANPANSANRELNVSGISKISYEGLPILDYLTPVEQEAFHEYVDLMTSDKFKMPLAKAKQEAAQLVARNKRSLQIQQAKSDYKRYGYIKIFSTHLDQAVYLARDERVAKRVPDQSLPVFTETELECLQGLELAEAKVLMEGKMVFGRIIAFQDQQDAKKAN